MRELILKKCNECGALVKVINDCHCRCGIVCCDEEMKEIVANSTDVALEKHVPTYEIKDNVIEVSVNHVMNNDHYIEWICFVTDDKEEFVYLKPEMKASATFNYSSGTLYAYCNQHGLWQTVVK